MTRPLYIVSGTHAALLEAATEGVDELEVERALEALDVAGLELAERVGGIVVGLEAIDADVERLQRALDLELVDAIGRGLEQCGVDAAHDVQGSGHSSSPSG